MPVNQVVTRSTLDGTSFISAPTVLCIPHQKVYRFDLLARSVKRYGMSVGASPITDYINFQISDIANIAEYTALFDQYRITSVSAVFLNKATQVYIGNSSGDLPMVTTAIDYNDNSSLGVNPTQYQTAVTNPMTTNFVRRLVPRTAMPVFNGVTSAYVMGPRDAWLDCTYTSVPHYQLIVNITNTSVDSQFVVEVDVLYSLEFQSVR